jgi:hypothetical protein
MVFFPQVNEEVPEKSDALILKELVYHVRVIVLEDVLVELCLGPQLPECSLVIFSLHFCFGGEHDDNESVDLFIRWVCHTKVIIEEVLHMSFIRVFFPPTWSGHEARILDLLVLQPPLERRLDAFPHSSE